MNTPWTYEAVELLDRMFADAVRERTLQHPEALPAIEAARRDHPGFLGDLEARGCAGVPGFFDAQQVAALAETADDCFRTGRFLRSTRFIDADYATNVRPMCEAAEVSVGEAAVKEKVNYLQVSEPLYNIPELIPFAFDERVLGLMGAYLGCPPLLTYIKLQRSFVNELEPTNTQLHHVDLAGHRLPKVLLYLNDVEEGGGAFTHVDTSHRVRFEGWLDKPRWTDAEMAERYGPDALLRLYGKMGDLLAADTVGFHCGSKPTKATRTIVILSYGAHAEYGNADAVNIRRSDLEGLSPFQRAAAGLLPVKD